VKENSFTDAVEFSMKMRFILQEGNGPDFKLFAWKLREDRIEKMLQKISGGVGK